MRTLRVPLTCLLLLGLVPQASAQQLDRDQVRRVGGRVVELVESHYVFDERKSAITGPIRIRLEAGAYDAITLPDSLAAALTRDLRAASGDMHLYVEHAATPPPQTDWDAWAERERREEVLKNFGFTDARVLPGNVGYLRIVEFMHPDRGFEAASSAMRFLANTRAMIVDLRGNGGGYGGLMDLVLSSFFEPAPTHVSTTLTSDRSNPPTRHFTLPFVPGPRRVGQPLYVIIDRKTGSAAEFFAYTLQAFDKATVVGEPSVGAAHMNSYFDIDERFRISISTGAPTNPVTATNWEGKGVQPDLTVPPDEALCVAHGHAVRALLERATDEESREPLEAAARGAVCE